MHSDIKVCLHSTKGLQVKKVCKSFRWRCFYLEKKINDVVCELLIRADNLLQIVPLHVQQEKKFSTRSSFQEKITARHALNLKLRQSI